MSRCWALVAGALLLSSCGGGGGGDEKSPAPSAEILRQFNVSYGVANGETLLLDIYSPGSRDDGEARPAVMLLHGGGWISGDKNEEVGIGEGLARLGYVAFAVNYRLASIEKNRFPAAIDDVQRSVRWVRAHAEEYGIDPNRLGVVGGSAGGHLAEILGTQETRDNSDADLAGFSSRVSCAVSIAGASDLTAEFPSTPANIKELVKAVLGKFPAEEASPIFSIDQQSAAFVLIHGIKDELVPYDQSVRFDAALRAAGRSSKLVLLPNSGHGIEDQADKIVEANETLGFLASCLELN